jgi:hypothetical protein
MKKPRYSSGLGVPFAVYFISMAVTFMIARYLGAISSGFSAPDEPAHFVNSYFIWDYLAHHFPANPLAKAREFYVSFPKLSIGHWPPMHYLATGLLFFVVPRTPEVVMAWNVVITAAPAFLCALMVVRIASWRWALFAGLAYTIMPLTVDGAMYFMLDQPVALLSLAAAMVWWRYSENPRYLTALLFGVLAGAAMLVKGTGWLLALFPPFHIVLGRHTRLLSNPRSYIAALVAAAPVLPWYLRTTGVSAEGFVYDSGVGYGLTALQTNATVLAACVGPVGVGLIALGVWLGLSKSRTTAVHRQLLAICASLILANLTLLSLVPAALQPRYVVPAIPAVVILAVMGLKLLRDLLPSRGKMALRAAVVLVAGAFFVLPALRSLSVEPPKQDLRMDTAAELAVSSDSLQVVVIDGRAGGEGSFVAEVTLRVRPGRVVVVRTSKLLSRSSFGSQEYQLLAETPEAVHKALVDLGASVVVLERRAEIVYREHSHLLMRSLDVENSPYERIETLTHRNGDGATYVYSAKNRMTPNLDRARKVNFPSKSERL